MDTPRLPTCTAGEKQALLALAHNAIRAAVRGQPAPEPRPDGLSPNLSGSAATFVTLRLDGQLRGCVGNLTAREPLYRSVAANAAGAALRDTRFSPVTLDEADRLEIHVSILSPLVPLRSGTPAALLEQITCPLDGVVLKSGGRTATFLPQVWRSFAHKEEFLEALSKKAGLDSSAWKAPGAELSVYRVSEFGETPVG